MNDETRAAAALLYNATMTTLRRCRGNSGVVKSGEDLAHCATPQLVDVCVGNETLMHALALDYALRCVGDLTPAKPVTAPTKTPDVEIDLKELFDKPKSPIDSATDSIARSWRIAREK